MGQLFSIHKDNPQARLLRKAVSIIKSGGTIVYPTDSGYAIGCRLGEIKAIKRLRELRQIEDSHMLTLVCSDLSELGKYAVASNVAFRLIKANIPGSYTFILRATKEVPKMMMHPGRKTIGLRVPDNKIAISLLETLDEPIMSTSLVLPESNFPLKEPDTIYDLLGKKVDLIIDGGSCCHNPTSIIDLTGEYPVVVRNGKGDTSSFII